MYCSTCGTAVLPGLNYCKNCGARIGGARPDEPEKLSEASFNLLVASVLGIPIAGLGIIIGLISVMKDKLGFTNEMIGAVVAGAFALLFLSEATLIFLLLQRARIVRKKPGENSADLNETVRHLPEALPKTLDRAKTRELVEPLQPATVTENTTRSLETVAREKQPERR